MDRESDSGSLDEVVLRDEILEATYWMVTEEEIATTVEPADLDALLDATADEVEAAFARMDDAELLARTTDGYELTDRGEYEAKRRFVDSFGHVEAGHAHAECGPDCWCHDPEADEDDVCSTTPTPE